MRVKWRYPSSILAIHFLVREGDRPLEKLFKIVAPSPSSEAPVVFDVYFFPLLSSSDACVCSSGVVFEGGGSEGPSAWMTKRISQVSVRITPKNTNNSVALLVLEMEGVEVGGEMEEYDAILQNKLAQFEVEEKKYGWAVRDLHRLVKEFVEENSPPLQRLPSLWDQSKGFSPSSDSIQQAYKECVEAKRRRGALLAALARMDEAKFLLKKERTPDARGVGRLWTYEGCGWSREKAFHCVGSSLSFLEHVEWTDCSHYTPDDLKILFVRFGVCGSAVTRRRVALFLKKIFSDSLTKTPISSSWYISTPPTTPTESPTATTLSVTNSARTGSEQDCLVALPFIFLTHFLSDQHQSPLTWTSPTVIPVYFYSPASVFNVIADVCRPLYDKAHQLIVCRLLSIIQKVVFSPCQFCHTFFLIFLIFDFTSIFFQGEFKRKQRIQPTPCSVRSGSTASSGHCERKGMTFHPPSIGSGPFYMIHVMRCTRSLTSSPSRSRAKDPFCEEREFLFLRRGDPTSGGGIVPEGGVRRRSASTATFPAGFSAGTLPEGAAARKGIGEFIAAMSVRAGLIRVPPARGQRGVVNVMRFGASFP